MLIARDPKNIESYRSLKRLFMESDRYDEAWCVCQVLCFLNKASQDDQVFYEKYRSRTLKQASQPIGPDHGSSWVTRRRVSTRPAHAAAVPDHGRHARDAQGTWGSQERTPSTQVSRRLSIPFCPRCIGHADREAGMFHGPSKSTGRARRALRSAGFSCGQ